MDNLLLLIHRIPYPPNKGDKIRSYHLLRHLAQHYNIFLATFVDDPDDWQYVPHVQAMCTLSYFGALNPTKARIRSLKALFGKRSLSLDYYNDTQMHNWVREVMARQPISRVVVFSSPMAQYAEPLVNTRRVVDFCDVDSDKWRQYADKKSWPMSWLYRHEAKHLLAYERHIAQTCDASLFVSAPEAELFRSLAPESAAKTGHFSNGVDTEFFSPARTYANPYAEGEQALVFCGAMDYWPNVDAVQWFANEILPAVRARHPQASFYIVGARPAADVQALASLPGVKVTGTVPDVRPYVAHAALSVAPLRIARGIQNKVLEAMAMAKTVVVSPQALEGIEAAPGREVLLAEDAGSFAAQVIAALDAPDAAIGHAARDTVETRYGWSSHLARVQTLLESESHAAG
ncbi:TIGR03087 family PEP-CTERM/XrtA system glycosyltransferase [Massilia arenosa]|uniref:TIGR03087 family PEP-CTERM/XrtA system glycosyltransferase n=1 Tax=Zemynaea arenosa TaxID=2561931 RepID=A0A4Y9SWE8_9BURK|nr:TIGR03087 family PEP-CTERM/XrtA system glycosyltransferase [Massilia arenosa]TFW29679.1 TIGR03087 family PEP-CTERM/XrtA system glycosyltransferase [Massilia arenosa]